MLFLPIFATVGQGKRRRAREIRCDFRTGDHDKVMARPRTLPDAEIFALVLAALRAGGDKAISFGNLSRACGLAPATLAQRFGTVEGMIQAALTAEWDRLSQAVDQTDPEGGKGVQGLLKALPCPDAAVFAATLRDPALRPRAEDWRERVETAIAQRRSGKGREAAALIFAAWHARQMWEDAGGKAFKLSDLVKKLG
jgi:AcrR family transcriptional regulator